MGPTRFRAGLRQEERRDEEWMPGELDDSHLSRFADTAHGEAAGFELPVVLRVHAVIAVVVFDHLGAAVELFRQRASPNDDALLLTDERALQRGDDEPLGVGAALSVVGVSEPENVARELDDRVLEAASGTYEWNAALPRVANR